jgi:hypothetical protein
LYAVSKRKFYFKWLIAKPGSNSQQTSVENKIFQRLFLLDLVQEMSLLEAPSDAYISIAPLSACQLREDKIYAKQVQSGILNRSRS